MTQSRLIMLAASTIAVAAIAQLPPTRRFVPGGAILQPGETAATVAKVHTGFTFTEGPTADVTGGVYFSDPQASKIYYIDAAGKLTTFMENTLGCNGLKVDRRGRLIACQGEAGRVITIDVKTKAVTPLAEQYNGKRFNRPNDLAVDHDGNVYFSDPLFGNGQASQDKMAVYFVSAAGKVTRIIDDIALPNGVALSPDEKTLYVLPTGRPQLMAYSIEKPGRIGKGRVVCDLGSGAPSEARAVATGGGDGLAVDSQGTLYLTVPTLNLIQVVRPKGETVRRIRIPERPSNCALGGKDFKTLFVTARTSVYSLRVDVAGLPPAASRAKKSARK